MDRARRGHRPVLVAVAIVLLGTAACGTTGGERAGDRAPTTTTVDATPDTTTPPSTEPAAPLEVEGDCPATAAIEEAVGEPVQRYAAFGGNLAGDLAYGSEGCSYETADAGLKVTVSRLSSDPPVEGRLFDALAAAAARDAERYGFRPLDDLGDEAYLDGRQVVVLDGSTMLFVQHLPPTEPAPGAANPALELAAAAVDLALESSAPDCEVLAQLVGDQLGEPIAVASMGGFLGLDEVDISTEGCSLDLDDGTEVTISVADADPWDAWVEARASSLFTSGYDELEVEGRAAFDTGDRLILDDGSTGPADIPLEVASEGDDLDAADAAELRRTVAALLVED